jgi:acyl transferase domain-containing protein
LVDLLRAAGVKFQAVVGHSSGEIAAAYAAGFITAWDANRIAYYRGFYANMAAGPAGEKGAMLAAGTSFEDASELCQVDDFDGRICVAPITLLPA